LDKKAHTTFNDEKETVKYIILNEIVRYFSLTIIASWYVGPFIKLLGPTTFLMDYGPTARILNKENMTNSINYSYVHAYVWWCSIQFLGGW
jgi:hypothetical protein